MLFADLTDQVVSDAVDWETLNRKGNGWWHKYTTTTDFEGDGARAQAIPLTEILDEQVDVTPATHLPVPAAPVWSRERLVHERSALTEKVGRMATKIEELPDRLSLDLDNVDLVTIEELEHSDMLRIRRRRARPELDVSTASDLPVLTPEDIAHHRPPSTRTVVSDGRSPDVVRTGDVLATIVAGRLFARCAAKTDVGAVLGSQLIILRADPRVLSPSYLAGCLSSRFAGQQTERNITSSGIHSASELRRIKIPLPTIAKQATMARLFEELDELAWNLREVNGELAALSDAYKDTFTSAVTSGRHSQSTAGTH